ncbi:MAG: ATP-binding protein [Paracoccaceae bacterium]
MQRTAGRESWERFNRLRKQRRFQNIFTLGLVILGPVLAFQTFLALGPLDQGSNSTGLRLVMLADLVYVLVVAALVAQRVARIVASRRSQSAGSRLHLRLAGVFALIALIPTISVAVFALLSVNVGLEGWFSERVQRVLGTSLSAAEAYAEEHRRDLTEDAVALAAYLNQARGLEFAISDAEFREILSQAQAQVQRGLREAYVIDSAGTVRARGERSYLFDFEPPAADDLRRAVGGETVIIQDWDNDEVRAIVALQAYGDRLLYISRAVDGNILNLLDDTKETVQLYQQIEKDRGRLLFEFGLLYLGFAVILILAAVWLGLWFAERLSRPVGRLAGAAQRVGAGDLDVQVIEEPGDDEIAMLGRVFNQMTRQLKGQRAALIEGNRATEERRRQFDSVLSSVTAGVIGLDEGGRIDFVNRAARRLLEVDSEAAHALPVSDVVPEFAGLMARLQESSGDTAQEELRVSRAGRLENLLVRIAERRNDRGGLEGYVVAFDDVTELVSAQRMAAWGDVARRIAHEIKNPLTPIQLSAERLKRRFLPLAGDQAETLEQYTDVIIRQTNDLRRIVDEFSKFARMPEPDRRENDLLKLLREAVLLQEAGAPGVKIRSTIPDGEAVMEFDATMLSQAMTNLIKNAVEATESLVEKGAPDGYVPEVRVTADLRPEQVVIRITDNGIGLPEDRARLFEPYVTTRAKGTGLGLPIVKKIIDEHGGTLTLDDAPVFEGNAHAGAAAEIRLPRLARGETRMVKMAGKTAVR